MVVLNNLVKGDNIGVDVSGSLKIDRAVQSGVCRHWLANAQAATPTASKRVFAVALDI